MTDDREYIDISQQPSRKQDVIKVEESAPIGTPDRALWIYQLNSADTIKTLEHNLRGEVYNDLKETWESKGKQLLNDEGIRMMITVVSSHLSKEKILSHIEEDQVRRMCLSMRLDVVYHIAMKWKEYEISKADFDIIVDLIDHTVFTNLSRSKDGKTLTFLQPQYRRVETVKPEEKKSSNMPSWIPFFSGGR